MKKQTIQDVIDYIENHMSDDVTIEIIADTMGYSRYYLHRLFDICTGMSMSDYLIKRRMQVARTELSSGIRILDLAIKYGYQSERSFRRAFQMIFHTSPSKLRQEVYHLPDKIHLNERKGITMIDYLTDIKTVTIVDFYAIGKTMVSKEPEIHSIDYMVTYKHKHAIESRSEIGIDIHVTEVEREKGLRGYQYFLVVDKNVYDETKDQNLIKIQIPESKYLMLTIDEPFKDPFIRIPMGWKKLMQTFDETYHYRDDLKIGCFEEKVETMTGTVMNLYIAI